MGLSARTGLLTDLCKATYRDEADFGEQARTVRRKVRQRALGFYSWLGTL